MNIPSRRTFPAAINRETFGEGKGACMLFSSPDIPGFYLCYEDPEQSYRLIEPLACFMIWRNLKKFVSLQSLDWQLLRDGGKAVAVFTEHKSHPGGVDFDLNEYGSLVRPDGRKRYLFLPSVRVKGEEFFREGLIHKIMQKSGIEPRRRAL